MTDNPNRIPFKDMPRKDQDRIAGAWVRGDRVEVFTRFLMECHDTWGPCEFEPRPQSIYRIPPTPKPAKDPNRPRPAHKLKLQKGDVVRHVGSQSGGGNVGEITVGHGALGPWLQRQINTPLPKGHRPLFVVVSRANGG